MKCMYVCMYVFNIIMLLNTTQLLHNYLQHILEEEMALGTLDSIHPLGPLHLDSPRTTHPKIEAKYTKSINSKFINFYHLFDTLNVISIEIDS